ncbi:MAG: DUF4143 domain-containing protein [Raoultibacter sp.]
MDYGQLINAGYQPRLLEARIAEGLEDFGAVCIQGPKYCGKTWTAQAFAKSEINLMDPAGNFQNLEIASMAPQIALQGPHPRLIDEWQEAPQLWDGVRNAVDRSGKSDTFLLTGSAVPREYQPKHSGVGRIEKLRMRPLSLAESGESNARVSLRALFAGAQPSSAAPPMTLDDFACLVVRGGWPASRETPPARAQRMASNYVSALQNDDLSRVDGKKRDPRKIARLLHSLARNAEQSAKTKTIIADMTEMDAQNVLAPETVDDYLDALEKIFIIEEIPAWSPHIRSSLRINKRPKYHFVDPSLTAAILKARACSLVNDLETFGFLFECLCMRDLLVYAQTAGAEVFYYRDKEGLEADAIIQTEAGQWAAIEIKLGHNQAEKAAANLIKVKENIVRAGGQPPAFLAVVEGLGKYAYVRADGVYVIPICTLSA